jgi:hypothetical protein
MFSLFRSSKPDSAAAAAAVDNDEPTNNPDVVINVNDDDIENLITASEGCRISTDDESQRPFEIDMAARIMAARSHVMLSSDAAVRGMSLLQKTQWVYDVDWYSRAAAQSNLNTEFDNDDTHFVTSVDKSNPIQYVLSIGFSDDDSIDVLERVYHLFRCQLLRHLQKSQYIVGYHKTSNVKDMKVIKFIIDTGKLKLHFTQGNAQFHVTSEGVVELRSIVNHEVIQLPSEPVNSVSIQAFAKFLS